MAASIEKMMISRWILGYIISRQTNVKCAFHHLKNVGVTIENGDSENGDTI